MKTLWLLLKNLLFTVLVPGFVVGWVPLHWFERRARWPETWWWPHWLGAALFALGAALFLWCQGVFMIRGQGTPAPFDPPRKIMRRGPYKWVRNPMYLAVVTLVAAEAVFLQSWHIVVYLVCLACALHLMVVAYEEGALRMRFGAMYEDYRREVPRWLPRKPRPSLATVAPFETKNGKPTPGTGRERQ
jgi:protein-S-isoprenylcysteine O-methyltransferase Ste14